MDIINQVTKFNFVDNNKIASLVLGLFLALYAALAAPNLPSSVTAIFKYSLFRLAVICLIIYMATKDVSTAIITAIAFLVTLQTLSTQETANSVINALDKSVKQNLEKFTTENFAAVPAKDSDNLDADIEDYSLQNSNALLYSGGGLHSQPDNVTNLDVENDTFNVRSPAFSNDERAIHADMNLYEQQIRGDTYIDVGILSDKGLVGDAYDNSKVQQVPFAHGENTHAQLVNELPSDSHPEPVLGQPVQAKLSKPVKAKLSKPVSEKKSKNVEGFSGNEHFNVEFEPKEQSCTLGCRKVENFEDEGNYEEENYEDENYEEENNEEVVEGFQSAEDFEGACGADPALAVPGFDSNEFASF